MVTEDQPVFELNKQKAAQILRETAIVEAINLKAAILFVKEEYTAAKVTIKRVPALNAGGIDPVTFHNQAIFFVTENSADSIKKMSHLLRDCLFPPETFQNLLFLYWKYYFYDLASELISDNPKFWQKLVEKDDYDYITTLIPYSTLSSPPCEIGRILVFEKIFNKKIFVKNYAFELSVNKIFLFLFVFPI